MLSKFGPFRRELEQYVYAYEDLRIVTYFARQGISKSCSPTSVTSLCSNWRHPLPWSIFQMPLSFRCITKSLPCRLCEQQVERFCRPCICAKVSRFSIRLDLTMSCGKICAVQSTAGHPFSGHSTKEGVRYELVPAVDGHSPVGLGLLKMVKDRPVGDLPGHPQFGDLEKMAWLQIYRFSGGHGPYHDLCPDSPRRKESADSARSSSWKTMFFWRRISVLVSPAL